MCSIPACSCTPFAFQSTPKRWIDVKSSRKQAKNLTRGTLESHVERGYQGSGTPAKGMRNKGDTLDTSEIPFSHNSTTTLPLLFRYSDEPVHFKYTSTRAIIYRWKEIRLGKHETVLGRRYVTTEWKVIIDILPRECMSFIQSFYQCSRASSIMLVLLSYSRQWTSHLFS